MENTQNIEMKLDHSFLTEDGHNNGKYHTTLIVLNMPIESQELFEKLMKVQDVIVCADGGANRLLSYS